MNRLQAIAKVHEFVIDREPATSGDVFMALRNEIDVNVLDRKQVEQVAKSAIETLSTAHFKVERAMLRLETLEMSLRADILDALEQLDVSDPRDCREVFRIHQALGTSTGDMAAHALRQAISALEASEIDVTDFVARLEAVYPTGEKDPEAEAFGAVVAAAKEITDAP